VIKTFSDKSTAAIFSGKFVKTLPHEIQPRARERLDQVHAAVVVDDLRLPPSNQLEALKGARKGQWSVRINRQWRVCFRFEAGNAFDVEITDYH
jgi:proteic killer suppression protein